MIFRHVTAGRDFQVRSNTSESNMAAAERVEKYFTDASALIQVLKCGVYFRNKLSMYYTYAVFVVLKNDTFLLIYSAPQAKPPNTAKLRAEIQRLATWLRSLTLYHQFLLVSDIVFHFWLLILTCALLKAYLIDFYQLAIFFLFWLLVLTCAPQKASGRMSTGWR